MYELEQLIEEKTLNELISLYPIVEDFLVNMRLESLEHDLTLSDALRGRGIDILEEFELTEQELSDQLSSFILEMTKTSTVKTDIESITIIGGFDKSGTKEDVSLTINSGEVVSIVGPTGAGKSQLLSDIECLAQGDTPTLRKILVNDISPDDDFRFNLDGKLVAQLSQNMNFVMDLSVKEFLEMHAKSRFVKDIEGTIEKCFVCANELAGESFELTTKVTQLSGGQSRALMIADTAFMSTSPIVLIDEIENAGIDRRQAIEILAKKEKIIFVSTHDPLLALSADKRIVIKNGGISEILSTTDEERSCLSFVEKLDKSLSDLRKSLRAGERITSDQCVLK